MSNDSLKKINDALGGDVFDPTPKITASVHITSDAGPPCDFRVTASGNYKAVQAVLRELPEAVRAAIEGE